MSPSVNNNIVVKDACIFFDLIALGLLNLFYELDVEVYTTPQVIEEITDPEQLAAVEVYIINGRLQIDETGSFDIIAGIVLNNRSLSGTDASVLELAQRIEAAVLSSDLSLRKETVARGITVRGILWIIEELHYQEKLSCPDMHRVLDEYRDNNNWSPKKEIDALKKRYL